MGIGRSQEGLWCVEELQRTTQGQRGHCPHRAPLQDQGQNRAQRCRGRIQNWRGWNRMGTHLRVNHFSLLINSFQG